MASNAPTPSRRAMLGAIAAVPLLSGPALAEQLPSIWEQRKAAFIAAKNAEDLFDRTVATPHWNAIKGSAPNGDPITAESDRLCDTRCDAEKLLIFTPAPDIGAVLWKITYSRDRWSDFQDWDDGWWSAVIADLKRLSGGLH